MLIRVGIKVFGVDVRLRVAIGDVVGRREGIITLGINVGLRVGIITLGNDVGLRVGEAPPTRRVRIYCKAFLNIGSSSTRWIVASIRHYDGVHVTRVSRLRRDSVDG